MWPRHGEWQRRLGPGAASEDEEQGRGAAAEEAVREETIEEIALDLLEGYLQAEADELMHASAAYQADGDTYQHGLLVAESCCAIRVIYLRVP